MIDQEIDSKAISLLRFPLALAVIFIHLSPNIQGWSMQSVFASGHTYADWVGIITYSISHILTYVAVPSFFMISGFLFFKRLEVWNAEVWKSKMTSRVHTILIPYLLWVTFYILFDIWRPIVSGIIGGEGWSALQSWYNDNGGLLRLYWCCKSWNASSMDIFGHSLMATAPYSVPLWFLRDLLVAIALTPVLYRIVKIRFGGGIILLLILNIIPIASGIPGVSFSTLFYFSLGAWFTVHPHTIKGVVYNYRVPLALVAILCFVILVPFDGEYSTAMAIVKRIYILTGVLTTYNIASFMAQRRQTYHIVERLSTATFFIYVAHIFFLPYIRFVIDKVTRTIYHTDEIYNVTFVNEHPLVSLASYFAYVAAIVSVCILIYQLLHRSFPKLTKILCGK